MILKRNNITKKQLAELFSISQHQLNKKFKAREFTSTELEIMLHILDFGRYHPMEVFFDTLNTKENTLNRWGAKRGRLSFSKRKEMSGENNNTILDTITDNDDPSYVNPEVKVVHAEIVPVDDVDKVN